MNPSVSDGTQGPRDPSNPWSHKSRLIQKTIVTPDLLISNSGAFISGMIHLAPEHLHTSARTGNPLFSAEGSLWRKLMITSGLSLYTFRQFRSPWRSFEGSRFFYCVNRYGHLFELSLFEFSINPGFIFSFLFMWKMLGCIMACQNLCMDFNNK